MNPMMFLTRVTTFCVAASYALALGFELWHLFRPRPILRLLSNVAVAAGLFAHLLFLVFKPLPLASPGGSLFLLAFILAIFSLYGALHHARVAWGLFVLPVVLGLVLLAVVLPGPAPGSTTVHEWFH